MRTRQLAAWPPIPAAQVPGFPVGEFDDWLMIDDPPRRDFLPEGRKRFYVYDRSRATVTFNGINLR
jgi:hypothetical protein